jgi:hypothetical protein
MRWQYVVALFITVVGSVAHAQVNVLTAHNNNQRTGTNLSEKILNVSNVNPATFGLRWQYEVEGQIYAQPLYMQDAPVSEWPLAHIGPPAIVKKNVLYVATMHNFVVAFDAGAVGTPQVPSTNPLWIYDAGSGKANPGVVPVDYHDVYIQPSYARYYQHHPRRRHCEHTRNRSGSECDVRGGDDKEFADEENLASPA